MSAKIQPIQQSFAGGEITPRMYARSDQENYHKSVKSCDNFLVHPQGPLDMRTGSEHLYRMTQNATYGRIFALNMHKDEAYALIITKDEMVVLSPDLATEDILVSPYSTDTEVRAVQKGDPPAQDKFILVNGTVAPQYVAKGTPFTTAVQPLTNAPAEWTGTVWPKVIGFYDGRMCLANIEDDEERYWFSKSGSFYNFDTGTGLDDEAIDNVVDERGDIKWFSKTRIFTMGTGRAINFITSEGNVLTPDDIQINLEVSGGSYEAQAVREGNTILYASPDGRKIYQFEYRFELKGWRSKDLTYRAEHITKNNSAIRLAQSYNPDRTLWVVTDAGTLLGYSYSEEEEIGGWHKHTITDGLIQDICVVEYEGNSQLWMLVLRGATLNVERLGTEYLDSYATQNLSPAGTAIGPFTDHLELETVTVIVDGAYDGQITLDSNGEGVITTPGEEIVVGKPYTANMESLNIDKGDRMGSAASLMKRWNKLFVHLETSALPKINGTRPATRSPSTPMGEVESLETEYVQVPTRGFTREGTITIEQTLPYKTTILALLGQLKQN